MAMSTGSASIAASSFSADLVALGAGGGEPGDGGLELRRGPRARPTGWRRAATPLDGGGPTTNVPAPWRVSTTPCSCSEASASRTDARLTSSVRARSRSDGSRSPGVSTPERMSSARRSAICS